MVLGATVRRMDGPPATADGARLDQLSRVNPIGPLATPTGWHEASELMGHNDIKNQSYLRASAELQPLGASSPADLCNSANPL